MRISTAAFCFATLVLATRTAGAGQSHYLLAKAFNNFLNNKVVMPPDLTPTAEATYEVGIGGDPVHVANHALVDSDQGLLLLTSQATQQLGLTQIAPADWTLAVRLEESAKLGTPAPSSIRVTLLLDMSGMVGGLTGIHQLATLDVNGCSTSVSRDLSMTGATNLVSIGGCNLAAIQGRVEGSAIIVDLQNPKFSALLIEAQIDETISYAGAFSGQFETFERGQLKIETAGGSLIFKSPTFLTKAEGAGDGGAPTTNTDAGGADAGVTDGGASDAAAGADDATGAGGAAGDAAGGGDAASAGGGGGGGCSVGASSPRPANRWPAGFAGILGAAALALRARRRR